MDRRQVCQRSARIAAERTRKPRPEAVAFGAVTNGT